jgi:hypothetical protein
MLTGDIRSQIDAIWNAFWTGGISNPLEVIEQITYLLFLKRLDDLHTLEENKAARLKTLIERRIFPEGADPKGRPYQDLRWSRFKNVSPAEMFAVVNDHVFPFLRTLGGDDSTYAHHMKDARFTIPTPALLAKVVDMLDHVPMDDRDTKGDLYEYMLGKIATAGQNGQFRTPRHIIRLMVEMMEPTVTDVICDPACGTCGFLVAAGEHLRERHPEILRDATSREHFHHGMFHGFDFDNTMLRIGSMSVAAMASAQLRGDVFDARSRQDRSLRDQHIPIAFLADELTHDCQRDGVGAMHRREAVAEEDSNEKIERPWLVQIMNVVKLPRSVPFAVQPSLHLVALPHRVGRIVAASRVPGERQS